MTQQWRATEGWKTKLTGCAMGAIAGIGISATAGWLIRLAVKAVWSESAPLVWIIPAIGVGLCLTVYIARYGWKGSQWPIPTE